MVDNPLHEPAVWRPLVEALLRSSPPDVRETEFVGSVSSGAYGGSTNYDGDPGRNGLDLARGERPMDALGPIAALVDGAGVAIRAVARSTGDGMVSIVAAAPQVTFGMGNQVLEVVTLVPGADPEPFRRTPVHHDGVTVSPGADPDAVTALVRELLPEARPASLAALAAAESRLGAALPEDVRALYLAAGSGELILRPRQEDRFYGLQIVGLERQRVAAAAARGTRPADAARRRAARPRRLAGHRRRAQRPADPAGPAGIGRDRRSGQFTATLSTPN
ncbi:SMI1/KNR4 family protein [Dactylosporangium sp. CA-152071]|uniref:SMI1/KNR4 family protein n=1 Tax=Dactylosporangium sp. CA-152071 TaxID=3239933 RepID=UPI003D91D1C6